MRAIAIDVRDRYRFVPSRKAYFEQSDAQRCPGNWNVSIVLRSLVPLSMDVLFYSHPKAPRGFKTLNIWVAEIKI